MSAPDGRPDAVDAARAMFFTLLAVGALWGLAALAGGVPREVQDLLMKGIFFAGPLLYARKVKLPPFEASGFARLRWRSVAVILLASLGIMWLLQGLTLFQEPLLNWLGLRDLVVKEKQQLTQGIRELQEKGPALEVFLLVVSTPLGEETLFRGLAFRGFARRLGTPLALGITTIFFAAMHQTFVQFALMAVLGAYFGTLVWLTGSLWAGILAHSVHNFAIVLLTMVFGERIEALRAPWWMYVLSAVVFAGAMALLLLDRRERATST